MTLLFRFGVFEVDVQAGELRKKGMKVRLQEQPFLVLMILLQQGGKVVTREDLQQRLWATNTFVDFERGLNRAVNKLREALGDDAESPRFIETLPRRGYRFLAPVEAVGPAAATDEQEGGNTESVSIANPPALEPKSREESRLPSASWVRLTGASLTAILALLLLIGISWRQWMSAAFEPHRPFLQMDLDTGTDESFHPAISPDGLRIAFVSQRSLAIRRLDLPRTITRLAGTEGAAFPFFSPNGQWIGFFAAGKLLKVAVEGGPPTLLCYVAQAGGGTWAEDDNIIVAMPEGLARVSPTGGIPRPLTDSRSESAGPLHHRWPQALPGGKGILFAAINGSWQGALRVLTPDGKTKTLVDNATQGRYLASGHLVYHLKSTLFSVPMDLNRLVLTGSPVPLVFGVSGSADRANFDLSQTGTLIYRAGLTNHNFLLSWLDGSGKTEPVTLKTGDYLTPRLSPDGNRVALGVVQDGQQKLWVYDIKRETWSRLTQDVGPELLPAWTPNGDFLAFRSGNTLAWIRADGAGNVARLPGVSRDAGPWTFSPDGKWLAFWPLQPGSDLWAARIEPVLGALGFKDPRVISEKGGSKGAPAISPDGKWLAYTSDESGSFEVYVMPFSPEQTNRRKKWLISNDGGWAPIWSRNNRELFYHNFDRRVRVAAYRVTGDSFLPEKPRVWSEVRLGDTGFMHSFDVAPGGKRLLALLPAEARDETLLHVMLNLDGELSRRESSGRR